MLLIFNKKRYLIFVTLCVLVSLIILDFFGIIWHNDPFAYFYHIKGIDVSRYQRNIDWKKVKDKGVYSFVYIKATEGHDYFDDNFQTNWTGAKDSGLLFGAYHFFSVRSSGKDQAEYFISQVPKDSSSLPPLIDIEIDITKDSDVIRKEIKIMANRLEEYYGKRPILYFTYDTYNAYIKGYFKEYKVWIRDVFKPPILNDRGWTFWQYKNRGRVSGIDAYVDINVFNGDIDELKLLAK